MPNEVECTLVITGDVNVVEDCLASIGSPGSESDDARLFDFNRVIPIQRAPASTPNLPHQTLIGRAPRLWTGVVGLAAEGFVAQEYGLPRMRDQTSNERVAAWGTKWNASDVTLERQPDGGARIRFFTAWAPPQPVIETLAEKFPSLGFDLTYSDEQMPVAGRMRRDPRCQSWATIDARFDYGFCDAVLGAESRDPFAEPPVTDGSSGS